MFNNMRRKRQFNTIADFKSIIRPHGKLTFLSTLPKHGRVLDVGCGNNSPYIFKNWRPDLFYIGLDVGDYNQDVRPDSIGDRYIVVSPTDFASEIEKMKNALDGVVSSHNLEHCDNPTKVLIAMLRAVKQGGKIYLAFPCEESINFPKRKKTLNFFDDPSHKTPLDWVKICSIIHEEGFSIEFSYKRYRPFVLWSVGLLLEVLSIWKKRVLPGTWEYWGFESIIWASRK